MTDAALLAQIATIRAELEEIRAAIPCREFYTVADIARRYGISETALSDNTRPWRLPCFGRPDWGESKRFWKRATVEEWYAKPEDTRRDEWEKMAPRDQRALQMRAS